jgi:ribosomal protein S18 acetylase RimI-like enzyme
MLKIRKADINNIKEIVGIAYETWFPTYKNVISQEQIDFMFGEMYTPEAIYKQMDFLGHEFYIAQENERAVGFASVSEMIHETPSTYKIHKLYFLPETHGKGFGKTMLKHLEMEYKERAEFLILNVNINNPAYHFYIKMDFTVRERIDIPYGKFMLNDFVMEKNLQN